MTDRKIQILVAEDEEFNFLYLAESLHEFNVELIRAKDGHTAVELCRSNSNIDLVLMDIRMPVMDGYTATREIKKFRDELPIIAQTAYAMESDKRKAIEEGCDDYISKPIKRQDLIDIIGKYAPSDCPLQELV